MEQVLSVTDANVSQEMTTLTEPLPNNMTRVTPSIDDDAHFYLWLAKKVVFVSLVFFPSVGSLSNLLTFLVCLRKTLRTQSWAVYLMALALADTFNLATIAACHETPFARRCTTPLVYSRSLGSWVVLAIAVDRLIVVYFPSRLPCTPQGRGLL